MVTAAVVVLVKEEFAKDFLILAHVESLSTLPGCSVIRIGQPSFMAGMDNNVVLVIGCSII